MSSCLPLQTRLRPRLNLITCYLVLLFLTALWWLRSACTFIFLPHDNTCHFYERCCCSEGPMGFIGYFWSLKSTPMPNVDTHLKLSLGIWCQYQHRKDLFSDTVGPSFFCICKVNGMECLISLLWGNSIFLTCVCVCVYLNIHTHTHWSICFTGSHKFRFNRCCL